MVAFLCVVLEPCQEDAPRELKPVKGSAQGRKREEPAPNPSDPRSMQGMHNRLGRDGRPGKKGSDRNPHRVDLLQPVLTHLICRPLQAVNTDPKLMV